MSKITRIPRLIIIGDDVAAAKLRELIGDAEEGFRRVVKAGIYIEWLAANLPHGELLPWIKAHASDVSLRSTYNWRNCAKNLCEWSGLKFSMLKDCAVSGDKLLDLPESKLPDKLQPCRQKIEEALSSSKSAKDLFLFLGFKQGEIDDHGYPRPKRGRRKGEGGNSRETLAAAKEREERERIEDLESQCVDFIEFATENADDKHIGLINDKLFAKVREAAELLAFYCNRLAEARKGK